MASYKKRKDGRYARQVVTGIKDGKPIRKTIYGKTLKELDKNYREFMDAKESGRLIENEKMTFRELSELWLVNTKKGELKPQSYYNLSSQIKGLNAYIGDLYVKDVKKAHFEQIRAELIDKGNIDKFNKLLSNARAILSYAIDSNMIIKNPTSGMKRLTNKSTKRALSDAERLLLEKADLSEFEKCFTSLLLYTGIRKGEALALNISDINFSDMTINVNKTVVFSLSSLSDDYVQDNTKTAAGTRTIPITSKLYPVLKSYCKNRIGILFQTSRGNHLSKTLLELRWICLLEKLKRANGEPVADDITPHIFRHTFASDLYKAGVDIKTAQYLLGHKDIKTTLDTYTHFGYVDVKIDSLEEYYKNYAVKIQSDKKVIPLKASK